MKIIIRFLRNIKKAPLMYYLISIVGVSNGFVLPFLKQINMEITNSYTIISVGEALFIIILASVGLIWGISFDNIKNVNIVMIIALEGVAISLYLTSITSTAMGYLLCRLLTGFFASATYPFVIRVVAEKYYPGNRIYAFLSAMVVINYAMGVGSVLAYVLSYYIQWRKVIALYALFVSLSPLVIIKTNPFTKNPPSDIDDNPKGNDRRVRADKIAFLFQKIFRIRTNIIIMAQGLFGCIPWGALGLFLIYAIAEKMHTDFVVAGLILSLSGFFYPFSLILAPKIDDIRKEKKYRTLVKSAIFVIIVQAIIYALVMEMNFPIEKTSLPDVSVMLTCLKNINVITMIILFGLFILISSLAGPITRNIIVDVNNDDTYATSLAVIRFFENMGSALGLIIGGLLVDSSGSFYVSVKYIWIFWFLCALVWVPALKMYPVEAMRQ